MPQPFFDIRGSGTSFAITQGGKPVAGHYTSTGNASAALRGVARRTAPVQLRPCMTCRQAFASTGKGHRLCNACRWL